MRFTSDNRYLTLLPTLTAFRQFRLFQCHKVASHTPHISFTSSRLSNRSSSAARKANATSFIARLISSSEKLVREHAQILTCNLQFDVCRTIGDNLHQVSHSQNQCRRIVRCNRFGSIINDCTTALISERWYKSINGFR